MYNPANKLTLSPNRRRLGLYRLDRTRNTFSLPKTCSTPILSLASRRFSCRCSFLSPLPRGLLCGVRLLVCRFFIPWSPLSPRHSVCGCGRTLERLKTLKSCSLPLPKAKHTIFLLVRSTTACAFGVWPFLLPLS